MGKRCQQEQNKEIKGERSKVPGQGLTVGCASEVALQAVTRLAGSERMTAANQSMKADKRTNKHRAHKTVTNVGMVSAEMEF